MQVSLQINWNFLVFPNEDTQDQMPSPLNIELSKKKNLLTIISKSPFLVSYMHSYVSTPPLSIFSPSPKTNRKRLLSVNLFYILYISISLFFSPSPSLSFAKKKKKKDSANKRWHGLSGKTNENDHFQLPTNNILLSQRSRSIFSHL